jgi:hypothetical protein
VVFHHGCIFFKIERLERLKDLMYKIYLILFCLLAGCSTSSKIQFTYQTDEVIEKNIQNIEIITLNRDRYEFTDSNFVNDTVSGTIKGITKSGEKISLNKKEVFSYIIYDYRLITENDKICSLVLKSDDQIVFNNDFGGKLDSRTELITGKGKYITKEEINNISEKKITNYDIDSINLLTEQKISLFDTKQIVVQKEEGTIIYWGWIAVGVIVILAIIVWFAILYFGRK